MRLTIEHILNFDIMNTATVKAGKDIINQKYVQWISAIEMPVENFVRKNEVVLTTAIGCGHDLELFKGFVQDIIESEATALIIAVGRYIFDIPKEVIQLAEEKQLIIIEIPWEVRFASIIENVMKELNDLNYKEFKKSERTQQELLKLILQGEDLDYISKFVQTEIGGTVLITDRNGTIEGTSSHSRKIIEKWPLYIEKNLIPSTERTTLTRDPMFQKFKSIAVEDHTILQLPILTVSGEIQGYLFVILRAGLCIDLFLTQYRVNVLEHAVTTIALWFSKKNAIEDTKMRLRSDFVHELAKGEFNSLEQAHSRAKVFGYNLKLPYICVLGFPENLKKIFRTQKKDHDLFEHWLDSMIHYIEEEISYAAKSLNKRVMMSYHGEELIIFLEDNIKNNNDSANNFLNLVERRLRNLLPEVIISWGTGNYHEGIVGLKESYENAKVALTIGRNKKGLGERMLYENTRIDRVLLNLAENEEMKEVILSTIGPLVKYDEQRNMDLIGTFTTYNHYHGNVSQTARALNLHRQSLMYRLRKIESLTGLSLIDPDDLFLLDLSVKIWNSGMSNKALNLV
ncbi:PucR family transcriptional regulator ligand-binding domain-containing protein (plasmid) [Priestia megaterium]|uniref:Bacterial regulatory, Fis family protein n=1 Tax=Priestia megaterium (strain ATCC 14581 / DSM 32 / CCUG 1817 / JCM 2506 / NBRC 15308 / NCIMB 9376 / NCTC 10342 / NRRL B-14308 / VKM B-512 / Ford 19) TaxID=1348623 RepID=A0A0B6A9B0_PRIM2|nr:PucR family transcriptional regulator [Priestia megaterium]AJI20146.1 bacterial regulatory, Fis family protein [Priestia megaterium NBRC 15308 = ATCC 14581]KFM94761.1 bacterial regulatory, Fis family protein [Priestia megaterium]KGJ80464.1 PucR family transcriptional regulator [Priestia megaterium NBRC 15308 = ATCC 14581]KLV28775.1 PucR family transcriptional regulator [Priestia megaterium]KNH17335.1 PucR family transcriptional regulator [Priestia megaterium]